MAIKERWGVFAWKSWAENTVADVHNAFTSKEEARRYASEVINPNDWDGVVIVPEERFAECWRLIGAEVVA